MPQPDPLADPALATLLDDLDVVANRPAPVPSPALAALMADGISPESPVPAPARRTTPRRKRKMIVSELLAGILAKLAGLGLAAKAGLGLTMAAASVTTAGVANVLPDPAQHAVATVIGAATPFQLPDPSSVDVLADDDDSGDVGDDLPGATTTTTVAGGDGTDEGTDGARTVNHGACVSAIAKDKAAQVDGNHGKAVSAAAQSDCGKDKAGSTTTTVPGSTTTTGPTTTTTSTTLAELGTSSNRGPGNGNGNPGNSGNGNSGNGNSGNGNGNSGRR